MTFSSADWHATPARASGYGGCTSAAHLYTKCRIKPTPKRP